MQKKSLIHLIVLGLLFLFAFSLIAQEHQKGLIFSEVYLDINQPQNSWIEVTNPTDKPLILKSFRYSFIRTPNILPTLIRGKEGIVLQPGEYLILCANEEIFEKNWGEIKNIIAFSSLAMFGNGGFFQLTTKNLFKVGIDAVRYGDPKISSESENFCGKQVVPFVSGNRSYSRSISKSMTNSTFKETTPTPGK